MTVATSKVIFDTDPGVDDAMALWFLARLPEVELVGITTVFGNVGVETTTRNAQFLKQRFGVTAPVSQGASGPLGTGKDEGAAAVHGEGGLGDFVIPDSAAEPLDPRPAHQFIIDAVRAQPGEITLLAVGRMTNLALALRQDPDMAAMVKSVVIMGGAFGFGGHSGNVTPVAEANIHGDPLAADEIFAAPWPVTVIGLDVTHQTLMTSEYLAQLRDRGGDNGQLIWDMSRAYERFYREYVGVPGIFAHDALAVAYLVAPDLFETRSGPIRVVTEELAVGQTIQQPEGRRFRPGAWDGRPSHLVCVATKSQAFLDLYLRTVAES